MKSKTALSRYVLFCALLLSFPFALFSQNNFKITGTVLDESSKPIQGVTVQLKGTTTGTATKADGTFDLMVPSGNVVLLFSSVGYSEQEIPLNGRSQLNVTLINVTSSLQDVVVVGYGTRKRVEVTGATTSISGENLRTVATTNLTQAMQGRLAGVVATPNTFRPGSGSTIRIRGNRSLTASNEPLYVVDGFPVSYTVDDMNPADIESIDILKDASATAIYGVRGANGVVQITTRKGKAGKISVNYSGSKSVETIIRQLPIFNGAEIADSWRQAFFADKQYTAKQTNGSWVLGGNASSTSPLYYFPRAINDIALFWTRFGSLDQWNAIKDAYTWEVYNPTGTGIGTFIAKKRATTPEERALMTSLGITTQIDSVDMYDPSKVKSFDWQNEVGLRHGVTDNHSISVTGGSEKIKSSFSAGYFKQKGIEYAQDYTRYSVGNSVDFKPAKFLNFGTSINYIHSISNTSTSSYANASGMIPLTVPFDTAGNWILYPNADAQIRNAINDRNTVFDETKVSRVFGNIFGEITLLKGLKYRSMFGLDSRNSTRGTFNGAKSSIRLLSPATASQTVNTSSSWVFDNMLTYNTRIKSDHSLNVTLLHEMQSLNRATSLTMSASNLIFEEQKWFSLNRNTDALVTGEGTYSASQYLSYMGRAEYGYKNKYMLTLSNRYDNSSVLSEGNKGAWFPSVSVAWQVDRESFFNKQSIFNSAKIRMGWGRVGNASIDPYQTNGPLGFTNYNWGNGVAAIGSAPQTFRTPELTWEKTTTTNVGIEFSMLKNRITATIDLYKSNTTDQLQKMSIPGANGVEYVYFNLGKVSNNGVELMLHTENMKKGDFSWSSDFMFSANKEKIVDIDGSGNNNMANIWILGQPLQVYWGFDKEGIFQYSDTAKGGILYEYYWKKAGNKTNVAFQPGRIRIKDANGDTAYSQADRIVLGSHNPDFIASFGNTLTYKNFDLNFLVYFRVGGMYRVPRPGLVGRYQSNKVNYWTPSNPSNDYQQPTQTSDIPLNWEALTYRDATFARVKNITLTYRVPRKLTSKVFVNNFSVYFSAVNPILIHSADKDYDPETAPYREFPSTTTNQVGPTSYSYRSYVFGVKMDL